MLIKKIIITINENTYETGLATGESTVYDILVRVWEYKNRKSKNKEINKTISMKDIEKYARNNDQLFLSRINSIEEKAANKQKEKNNYDKNKTTESDKWKDKAIFYFVPNIVLFTASVLGFINIMITVLSLFFSLVITTCGVLSIVIYKKTRAHGLTQKGRNEQEMWKGLKRYMENFSLLNEREVPELVLWEKYLVYATAFGIADKVLKQLKIKYPELNDENFMLNNGYTYMYMMNRYNFDRALNAGIHSAYSAGMTAKAAREIASSSSYSSGGGRRRRFLFRRRRPVAAGGRNGRKIEEKRQEINMRRKVIAGNWKMNMIPNQTIDFIQEIEPIIKNTENEVVLCVPYIDLFYAILNAQNTNIKIGAQNMHFEESGAFTGEISGQMLKSIGVEYVIIGHSERRKYFGENDEIANKKIKAALKNGLKPIVCIGETLEEKEEKLTFDVLTKQTRSVLERTFK